MTERHKPAAGTSDRLGSIRKVSGFPLDWLPSSGGRDLVTSGDTFGGYKWEMLLASSG